MYLLTCIIMIIWFLVLISLCFLLTCHINENNTNSTVNTGFLYAIKALEIKFPSLMLAC